MNVVERENIPKFNKLEVPFKHVEQIYRVTPCYGTHGSGQPINSNSIQEEYNNLGLVAEAYGYQAQFRPYQGAKNVKQVAFSSKWGLPCWPLLRRPRMALFFVIWH